MALIFSASTDVGSSQRSSRLIAPLLRWLFPRMSAQTIDAVVLAVRKSAHVTEYTVLTLLVWRALRQPVRHDPRPWSWRPAALATAVAIAYAGSDELHQAFVPSRQAQLIDVLLDTTGALIGLVALALWARWRARGLGLATQLDSSGPPTLRLQPPKPG